MIETDTLAILTMFCIMVYLIAFKVRPKKKDEPVEISEAIYELRTQIFFSSFNTILIGFLVSSTLCLLLSGEVRFLPGVTLNGGFYSQLKVKVVGSAHNQQNPPQIVDPIKVITKLQPPANLPAEKLRALSLIMGKKAQEFQRAAESRELENKQHEIQRQIDELERKRKALSVHDESSLGTTTAR